MCICFVLVKNGGGCCVKREMAELEATPPLRPLHCSFKTILNSQRQLLGDGTHKTESQLPRPTLAVSFTEHRKNCECCPVSLLIVIVIVIVKQDCHEFRFSIVRIVISVSNDTSLQDCLFNCQNGKSYCLNCENCRQLSKIVKIVNKC